MELKYYYNEEEKSFIITNGLCKDANFVEITEEEYKELQEELNSQEPTNEAGGE